MAVTTAHVTMAGCLKMELVEVDLSLVSLNYLQSCAKKYEILFLDLKWQLGKIISNKYLDTFRTCANITL